MKLSSKLIIFIVFIVLFAHGLSEFKTERRDIDIDDDETLYIRSLDSDYELWPRESQDLDVHDFGIMPRTHFPPHPCPLCERDGLPTWVTSGKELCELHQIGEHPGFENPDKDSANTESSSTTPGQSFDYLVIKDGRFVCKDCGRTFSYTWHLKRHKNDAICLGTLKKYRVCWFFGCGAIFEKKGLWDIHVSDCQFKNDGEVDRKVEGHEIHTLERHQDGEKIVCKECGSKFKVSSAFNKHLKRNLERSKHKCSVCHQKYRLEEQLVNHVSKVHPENPNQ